VAQLTGTITVHGDKPAKQATVELINETGDVVDQILVSDDGRYAYHLAAGNWTLNIYDPHGHRGREVVHLGDEDITLNVDLGEPEGGH
jgi:hypothetical protein